MKYLKPIEVSTLRRMVQGGWRIRYMPEDEWGAFDERGNLRQKLTFRSVFRMIRAGVVESSGSTGEWMAVIHEETV
jgi:hypothetical protein